MVSTHLTAEDSLIVEEYKDRRIGLSMEIPSESPTHTLVFKLGTKGLHFGIAQIDAELDSVTSYVQSSISMGEVPFNIDVDLQFYGEKLNEITGLPEEYCAEVFGKCITSMMNWIKRDFPQDMARVVN